jgi:serine/threonine protein kinase
MEFIPGEDLGAQLDEGRSVSLDDVMRWADQLLDALEYLHTLDPPVLHRDIKPSNLKLVSRGQIVLLDFGLAKGAAGEMTRTPSRSILGYSPNYSALEQIQGTGTDPRSDLYSLSATLYHLITGVKPPDALTRATELLNGREDPLQPLQRLNPEVPTPAATTLMRALALDIGNRPPAAAAMRAALHARTENSSSATMPMVADDERTRVRTLPTEQAGKSDVQPRVRNQVVVPLPEETFVRNPEEGNRRWVAALAAVIVLAAGAGFGAYYLYFNKPQQSKGTVALPITKRSPVPSPSLPLNVNAAANTNQPANVNTNVAANVASSPAPPSADQLAARDRLAQRNIPFDAETFGKAASNGDVSTVDTFLAAGIDPNATSSAGRPALLDAAASGSNHITDMLLRKGANVNASDQSGKTALSEAVANDHKQTVNVLLQNGANVNAKDNDGRTALMQAAIRGRKDLVRALIDAGARTDITDKQGRNALQWAEINGRTDVVDLLRRAQTR